MLPKILYDASEEIASRLEQLGVTEMALREAIYQGHLQRTRLTPNHPRNFPGLVMWGEVVAALRDQLRPLDWIRQDVGSFPVTVNESLNLAIAVASGDEGTGNPYAHPSNRSKKGRNTVEAIEANRQMVLFEEFMQEIKDDAEGNQTWILMHHTDTSKGEIRFELSLPAEIGNDGKITSWSERILLGSIPFDDDLTEILEPGGPDIDIEIRRKA
ncbi:TPA: hypothetical protein QEL11_001939 [Stenotrophomonas maltophilia]|nr:hypothetical protein [Stenotrophomonas maltophilia]